ncbi:MAG: ABC-type transport auxiliary lipoprotein family protein [Variibacter sp.]
MEYRARYVLVGSFVVVITALAFGFVYWLHGSGRLSEGKTYAVQFEGSVSGLRKGSSVLFNGVRIGEITDLRLDRGDSRHVNATILVDPSTPIRADTRVSIETQGLMASPSLALYGGSGSQAPATNKNGIPTLTADAAAGRDMMQSARDTLNKLNDILTANAEPLHSAVVNIDTFSGALSRNAGKLDGIVDGLARLTGATPAPTPKLYDLSAVTVRASGPLPEKQLVVGEPTSVIALDTRKIVTLAADGEQQAVPDAQWTDNIPKLVQSRIIQSFENADFMKVSRPLDNISSEFQLVLDVRNFQIIAGDKPTATVEIVAKLLDKDGQIRAGNVFRAAHAAPESAGAAAAVAALNIAFGKVTTALVPWALATMRDG